MQKFILTCCSTVDLSKEYLDKLNVPCTCFHYNLDGVDYPDDFGASIPYDVFYQKIKDGATPTTSQVNVEQYIEFFEPFLKEGKDILHISFSSGLSGTYNSAQIAANELCEKYPDSKLYIVDSLGASSGYGLFIDKLASLRDSGISIEEARDWAQENKLNLHHWFFSTDLTSYIRGGRVSPTAGKFANILGICPLLNMNNEGKLIPRHKIRSKKKVIEEIVKKMELHAQNGLDYDGKCFISESACYDDARAVADLVEAKFKKLAAPVQIFSIGTVIGSHTGPSTVALFFFGDKRGE